jgi:hypothetical protein
MSSNVLFPEFWAQEILLQLYSKSSLLALVHKDFSPIVAQKGEIVHVVRPEVSTVQLVDTSNFTSEVANPEQVNVTLDTWCQTKPKAITDKVMSMSYVDLVTLYMEPMAQGLLKYIEQALIAKASTFTNHIDGIPSTVAGFAAFKTAMDKALMPDSDRNAVLGPDAELAYQGLYGMFNTAGQTGVDTQVTGALGTKHGIAFKGSTLIDAVDTNLAGAMFHKNAVCLVSRPPVAVPFAPPGSQAVINFNGLGLRVSFVYDGKAKTSYVDADILFGTKVLDLRLGVRLNKVAPGEGGSV